MTSDPDDALRWDGDEPERASAPAVRPAPPSAASAPEPDADVRSSTGSAEPRTEAGHDDAGEDEERDGIGNVALVFYGIIGGVYLLFAVGWAVGGFRLRPRASLLLPHVMSFPRL